MKALVTGGLGFIGSHVVDLLVERGHDVHVVDDLSTGSEENRNNAAAYEIHSICDRPWLCDHLRALEPDWIFHLAALPRIQPSFDEPELHDDVNVRATLNLVRAATGLGRLRAIVYSSSSAVYGTPTVMPTPESAAIDPLSPYALQKYTAERYLHILSERLELPVVSLRYFNPYGPRSFNTKNPYNAYTSVLGIFKNQRASGQPLTITGNGLQQRDFIHVKDVARANLAAAERIDQARGKVYNVGSGNCISILDAAKLFNHPYVFIPERKGEARITHADCTALFALGWKPEYSLLTSVTAGDL